MPRRKSGTMIFVARARAGLVAMSTPNELIQRSTMKRFRVAGREIDVEGLLVCRGEQRVRVAPRVMAILAELAARRGAIVSRAELLDRIWGASANTPDVLNYALSDLRRALQDDAKSPEVIETVPRLGYRLVAPIELHEVPSLESTEPAPAPTADPASAGAPGDTVQGHAPSRWPLALVAFGLCALAGAGWLWSQQERDEASAATGTPLDRPTVRYLTSEVGNERQPAPSADGLRVAYVTEGIMNSGESRVMVRDVDGGSAIDAGGGRVNNFSFPVWHRSGSRLAFVHRTAPDAIGLVAVGFPGGTARAIAPCLHPLSCDFDWMPEGSELARFLGTGGEPFWGRASGLELFDLEGARRELALPPTPPYELDLDPRISPDGRRLAFLRGVPPVVDVVTVELATGRTHAATRGGGNIRSFDWLRDSEHVVMSSDRRGVRELFVACADADRCTPHALGIEHTGFLRASRGSDLVAFEQLRVATRMRRFGIGARAGPPTDLFASTGVDRDPALSPDERQLAFASSRSGEQALWLGTMDIPSSPRAVATRDHGTVRWPAWHPSGRSLLFLHRIGAISRIVLVDLASGRERTLQLPHDDVHSACFGDGGDSVVYSARDAHGWQLYRADLRDTVPGVVQLTRNGGMNAMPDADGRRLFFQRPNVPGIFALSLDGGEEQSIGVPVLPWQVGSWRRVPDGITWLQLTGEGPVLVTSGLDGRERSRVALPSDVWLRPGDGPLAIGRDGSYAVIVSWPTYDTDIGMVTIDAEAIRRSDRGGAPRSARAQ